MSAILEMHSFTFGDSAEMADELLALVLAGRKTATCWAASLGRENAQVGQRYAVRDGAGRPRAVIQSLELVQRRLDQVDEAFAFDEGEGDRTLAGWRAAHRDYFVREGTFAPDMLLWCERFRLVETLNGGQKTEGTGA